MLRVQAIQQSIRALKSTYPWITTPLIVSAPMKNITGPALAVAVAEAGGIGFIGPGDKPEHLEQHLQQASELVAGSNKLSSTTGLRSGTLPLGFAIQTWTSDLRITRAVLERSRASGRLPAAAWLFAPRHGQPEVDAWSEGIRSAAPGIQIWIQVASVADALAAARSPEKPDALVVQGHDAGGHSLTKGAGIVTLLPEVSDAVAPAPGDAPIPLIAAGGIADARGAAAAFALGAAGVAMGTRFLASKEAQINPGYQKAVIDGSDGGQTTVRTQLYNHLRGTLGWPEAFDARGLINASWRDHEAGVSFEENQRRYKEAVKKGAEGWGKESGRIATYAGTDVGLVKEVRPAKEIVGDIRGGIRDVLDQARSITSP